MRNARPIACLALLLATGLSGFGAQAQGGGFLRERLRQRFEQQAAADEGAAPRTAPARTLAYGADPMQRLDYYPAQGAKGPAPLILFVHGGGWSRGTKDNGTGAWKPAHYPAEGIAFATIDYRLVPAARVEDEAADVAQALAALIAHAGELGIDPHRIVLMGHSAGAHMVALVGTDESYLKAAGLSFGAVAGFVPIDGAAYDVAEQMQSGPAIMQRTYTAAFGSDPARQRALSPTMAAHAPNPGHFLILHVQRPDGIRQSERLADALRTSGASVAIGSFPGEGLAGHMTINRRLGDPTYEATGVVDTWLKQRFGQ